MHFFTKTVKEISNARGNFIVVTKQEILVISGDAASRRHTAANDTQSVW